MCQRQIATSYEMRLQSLACSGNPFVTPWHNFILVICVIGCACAGEQGAGAREPDTSPSLPKVGLRRRLPALPKQHAAAAASASPVYANAMSIAGRVVVEHTISKGSDHGPFLKRQGLLPAQID